MPYLGATTLADTLADLRSRATLPDSGEGLLSTLATRRGPRSRRRDRIVPGRTGDDESGRASRNRSTVPDAWPRRDPAADHAPGRAVARAGLRPGGPLADGAGGRRAGPRPRARHPPSRPEAGQHPVRRRRRAAPARLQPRRRHQAPRSDASVALVGGTLPYMAPEHLERLPRRTSRPSTPGATSTRSGVILYELLTGRHPFPVRGGAGRRDPAGDDRRPAGPLPDVRPREPAGLAGRRVDRPPLPGARPGPALPVGPRTPGGSAAPARRPARSGTRPSPRSASGCGKWARRHPRLTSSTTVGLVATLLLLASVGSASSSDNASNQRLEALESSRWLGDERTAGRSPS